MPKKKSNKSQFVRSLPGSMPAAEVVAKAKAAGMAISTGLVYAIRSVDRRKDGKGKKSAGTGAAKGANGKLSASDFIRALPGNTKATQVVKKGASQGYSFKVGLVYKVRRTMKNKPNTANSVAAALSSKPAPVPANSSAHRVEFRRLLILVGLDQGEAFCTEMRHELQKLASRK